MTKRIQYEEHARNDVIQACVLLVSARFGDEAGEWLLAEMRSFKQAMMESAKPGRTPELGLPPEQG